MTPPPETDEGGSRPRRMGSMIAGRRRASDARPADASGSASGASSSGARSRRGDDEERPQAARSSSREASEAENDDQPRVRRTRRGGAGRSRSRATDERRPDESTAETTADLDGGVAAEPEAVAEPVEAPARRSRTTRTSTAGDAGASDGDVAALRQAIERQERALAEIREGIAGLGERIVVSGYRPRVAVFVDVPNLIYGYEGDGTLHMGNLLRMLTDGRDLVRATAYSPVSDDPREPVEQQRFVAPFVPHEYRIVTKPLKRFSDGSIKGNFDVEMAVDMVLMADRVDVIAIVSGDADFQRAVEVVQQKGVRVEVVAFAGSTSIEMRALADRYLELDRHVKQIT